MESKTMDGRWRKLAEILVHYSTGVQDQDRVLVTMMEVATLPLLHAVYEQTIQAGGLPQVEFQSSSLEAILLRDGSDDQLAWVPEPQIQGLQWADAYIALRGAPDPRAFEGVEPRKLALHKQAMGQVSAERTRSTRWVLARIPNEAMAREAGLGLDEMMDFFFSATLRDWSQESKEYRALSEVFQRGNSVRIFGHGTDLEFSTQGRSYVIEDGHINMPGGEIFTAPVEESAEGVITFDTPAVYGGQLIHNVRLTFRGGQVVEATADENEELLLQILDSDEGVRRIGEFGVGTNAGIDRFCQDILFDEKIKGTVHIALGRSYTECGGKNYSAIHWDIVKDLRQQGRITLDGRLIFENGKFLV